MIAPSLRPLALAGLLTSAAGADLRLVRDPGDHLHAINPYPAGTVTLETGPRITGPWSAVRNAYSTGVSTDLGAADPSDTRFYRAVARDLADPQAGFSNLLQSYSLLETIAGAGGSRLAINKWLPEFEGRPATEVELSRPHIAVGDDAGNIYIADKEAHAIRVVRPDGTLHTFAGTNAQGDGPEGPATACALNRPNGVWARGDGVVYILDTDNNKVRRVSKKGECRTLFKVAAGLGGGRGFWVNDTETLAYMCCSTVVRRWTPTDGVKDIPAIFTELGNLTVSPAGQLVVTDRGAGRVFELDDNGTTRLIAGNGDVTGGGDGQPAVETGLYGVRGVAFLPVGGYLLSTAEGSQVWYVDPRGIIHLLINGARPTSTHAGDGQYFYQPDQLLVSETRAVTLDRQGNVLITENDMGYIRRIRFLPPAP